MNGIDHPVTYDQWRTFLGLPEVSQDVKTAAMEWRMQQYSDTFTAKVTDWTKKLERELQPFIDAMTDMANMPTGGWSE